MTPWPISVAVAIRLVWTCLTALGSPVEPDVYIQNATSSDMVGAVNGVGSRLRQHVLEKQHVPQRGPVLGAGADHDDRAQARQAMAERQQDRGQRRGDDGRRCAAVRKQIGVLLGGQQRVDRNGHDAGADRAPEGDGMIDGVVEQRGRRDFPRAGPAPSTPPRNGRCSPAAAPRSASAAESVNAILSPRPRATLASTKSATAL